MGDYMATYVIGDVQGCFGELLALLESIQFDPSADCIYFVGDLVNRGPASLDTLRWIYSHRHCIHTVLGNHDLFLLSCWLGISQPKSGDTISDVLLADDADELLNWLIQQPLIVHIDDYVIVHAGVYPGWTLKQAQRRAEKARLKYSGTERLQWFNAMFGNKPSLWSADLTEVEKFRFTINSMTRMRFYSDDGLDFKYKGEIDGAPIALRPWFLSSANSLGEKIIFGHWSALGLYQDDRCLCLDTGCIWGGSMTALCIETQQLFSVPAQRVYQDVYAGN
jgi:bis(5'-nucleosyl)-tetraphosphatase (symmetrical)